MMQLMVDDLDAWWTQIQSLDLPGNFRVAPPKAPALQPWGLRVAYVTDPSGVLWHVAQRRHDIGHDRSEEHTSELQSLMRISYAVFCLNKKRTYLLQNLYLPQTNSHHHVSTPHVLASLPLTPQ